MNVSLVMGTFKRTKLLDLNLWAIAQQKINYELEIIVCNDYLPDDTEKICNKYKNKLNIKYIFTGQRNLREKIKSRNSGFALNIGVKKATGDILILTCAEIFQTNNAINLIVLPLINNKKLLSIPTKMGFDDTGKLSAFLLNKQTSDLPKELLKESNKKLWNEEG